MPCSVNVTRNSAPDATGVERDPISTAAVSAGVAIMIGCMTSASVDVVANLIPKLASRSVTTGGCAGDHSMNSGTSPTRTRAFGRTEKGVGTTPAMTAAAQPRA